MTKECMTRLHRIYSILLSIVIVISGICLIAACIGIYKSGAHPFSRQAVSDAFAGISFPVYLCLIMTILGFIIDVIIPTKYTAPKNKMPYSQIVKRMYEKKDLSKCDETVCNAIGKEQKKRRLHSTVRTVIMCLAGTIFLVYALNTHNFHQSDINGSMLKAMCVLIPCLTVTFCYTLFTVYYNEQSLKKEFELIKQLPASGNKAEACAKPEFFSEQRLVVIRFAVLIIALSILIYGFINSGTVDVLTKAVNICTECIGLG